MIAALVVTGCATVPQSPNGEPGPLPYVMLPPESLGHGLSLSQVVTGDYGDESYSMRFEVEVTGDHLVMVGLSHLGVPLFLLKQDAEDFSVQSFTADQVPFDPRHILSDFQLTHWPEAALTRALAPQHLRLEDEPDQSTRRVFDAGGRLLIEISHPGRPSAADETIVQHFDRPYRLRIKTLEAREVP